MDNLVLTDNFEKKTLVRQGNGWGGELRVEVSGRQVDQLVVWSDPNGGTIRGGESHTELVGRSRHERLETVPHSDLIIGTGSESITINARDITILDSSKSLEPRDDQEELMWEENPDRNHFEEKDDKPLANSLPSRSIIKIFSPFLKFPFTFVMPAGKRLFPLAKAFAAPASIVIFEAELIELIIHFFLASKVEILGIKRV